MPNNITIVNKQKDNNLDTTKKLLAQADKLTIGKLLNDSSNLISMKEKSYIGIDFGTSTTVSVTCGTGLSIAIILSL